MVSTEETCLLHCRKLSEKLTEKLRQRQKLREEE